MAVEADGATDPARARAWIPTLEAARTSGVEVLEPSWWPLGRDNLLAEDPTEVHALAAVMLDARMATRESRAEEIDLPDKHAGRSVDKMPPPRDDYGGADHVVFEGVLDATPRRCTLCAVRPGLGPCMRCTGTGKVPLVTSGDGGATTFVDCIVCDRGFVLCTRCEGSTRVVLARARFVHDRPQTIKHLYVPGELSEYDSVLERALEGRQLPVCLRFDPRARRELRSAYRGVVAFGEVTFLGHRFGDALDRVRSALAGMPGDAEVVREEIRVHAWPLVWLRWGQAGARGEALLAVLPDGQQVTFVP